MAAGLPVVVALDMRGDAPKLVAEAKAGFCLTPEDPQALADALIKLYHDPALCQRLGTNGRRYVEGHLSSIAVAERYEQLFKRLTAK